jgi:hypothetical protein
MTQATDEPNQETQVSRYISQGQYVKGAWIKKRVHESSIYISKGIERISLHRITWDWQELQF